MLSKHGANGRNAVLACNASYMMGEEFQTDSSGTEREFLYRPTAQQILKHDETKL